jgi:hypothetical protein
VLGRVTSVSPLRVQVNGDTADTPAEATSDFTGASVGTEVLVDVVERRRFARRVY